MCWSPVIDIKYLGYVRNFFYLYLIELTKITYFIRNNVWILLFSYGLNNQKIT